MANRKKKQLVAEVTKISVEVILVFLSFRIGGVETGLLTMAAAGTAAIRTSFIDRTEVYFKDERRDR